MSWQFAPASALATDSAHQARWQQLYHASGAPPVLALELALACLAHFASGRELLAWHESGQDTDVMAIVAPGRAGSWNTFQPAQAPVGLWLQRDTRVRPDWLAALLRALPGSPVMLGLTQCDPELMARPPSGGSVQTLDYIETARVTVSGSFDAYWNARGKNLRSNLRKQRRHLAERGMGTHLQICRQPHEMADAVADYGRLECAGWKARDGTAVAEQNAQGRFYRQLLEAFAWRGSACVYRYWIGGQLAAMDLCIEDGGCLVVLKTAYDERLGQQLSPALLMREEATRAIFESHRIARIEFYGRVMEWHRRWTDEIRTLYHLNAARWSWLLRLRALLGR